MSAESAASAGFMAEGRLNEDRLGDFETPAPADRPAGGFHAPWMFWIAFLYLVLLAVLLPHGGADKLITERVLYHSMIPVVLFAVWAIVIAESLWGWRLAPDPKLAWKRLALVVLLPPFRMVISPRRPNVRVWLPGYHWREVSTSSVTEMEQRTAIPMLLATALIVPVLIVDFGFAKAVEASYALRLALAVLMALIWFSFALEFVVMVSLAPKKLAYCKKHWINIVIIILPLVAFLRTLQIFRFLRVARAGKLAKAYRLRGLATRTLKIALAFNLIERILSMNPERYAASLEDKIAEKEEELAELRDKLDQMHRKIAERAAGRAAGKAAGRAADGG